MIVSALKACESRATVDIAITRDYKTIALEFTI
jgi:hypothetical protein